MTFEMALAFGLMGLALVVFALELYPIDFVAFGILATILLLSPTLGLEPKEVISGFSNTATITVMAMFILSGGILRTGALNLALRRLLPLARGSELRQLLAVLILAGSISGFINDTPTVAMLMPVVISLARQEGTPASKLLIPLSYTAQLGGVITLVGTSSNILASSLMAEAGYGDFGIFTFSAIGLAIFFTGALYLLTIGRRLLPVREAQDTSTERYRVREYLTEVRVESGSPLAGKTIAESALAAQFNVTVVDILRDGASVGLPTPDQEIKAYDILLVEADTDQVLSIKDAQGLVIEPEVRFASFGEPTDEIGLMDVVIGPTSELRGSTLEAGRFRNRYNSTVLAVQKRGEVIRDRLAEVPLAVGDSLLVQGKRSALDQIKNDPGFIATEEVQLEAFRTKKAPIALAIIVGVVLAAGFGLVPILVSAIVGCVLMVLTGCLKVQEMYESIRWDVIFLLAGVIPLGLALERTGGARWLADHAAGASDFVPPVVLLMIFYTITAVLTELISNNASVVVMVPVAVITAETVGLDPRAFILAVMFAASTSFTTPVGYQTNTMVYGAGGYRFLDFARVGAPLNLMLAILTPIYIAVLWGL